MSEYFVSIKTIIKKYTQFIAVTSYLLVFLVMVLNAALSQQKVAAQVAAQIQQVNFQIELSSQLSPFIVNTDIEQVVLTVASGRKIELSTAKPTSGWQLSHRFVSKDGQTLLLWFEHPFCQVAFSSLFISLTIIWLSALLLIYRLFKNHIYLVTAEIRSLEEWAHVSRISSDTSQDLIQHQGSISMAVRYLQQQYIDAERNSSKVDQYIRRKALLDGETGIGNREFFNNRLEVMLAEADADTRGAVMFVQFKELEVAFSLYGHQKALALLESCIHIIQTKLNELPKHYFIARRGDYDIALLLPGLYVDETEQTANKLIKAISKVNLPIGINKDEFCHIGVGYFYGKQKSYQIMAEADMALRSAQLQGPSQWFMYDPGEVANESAKGSLRWRTFLNWALETRSIDIYFQPVIAAKTNSILHYEVLSKVKDKQGKLIGARVFWPMAKKCGLSARIDLLVLEKVCQMLSKNKQQGVMCSLNLSVDSLLSEGFITMLERTLSGYSDLTQQLIVEISEYHLVAHYAELKPVLAKLHLMGLKLLTDRVGQFVVSADYIKNCHIDYMKLHRSIVLKIHEKAENQAFIRSMKAMADDANVPMYALGVEDNQEWQTLLKLGVDGGQGHYFIEPVAQMEQAIGQN